jgi:tetratricopeptide (TPR) repeat protein
MRLGTIMCSVVVLIAGACLGAQSQATDTKERLAVAFPGKTWEVQIDSPGFTVQTEEQKSDGRQYLMANNPASGLVVSVTLEATNGPADAKTCPAFLKQRAAALSNLGLKDVKSSEVNSMAVIEYLIPNAGGVPVQQKNLVLCAARENVFIDVHLSKVQFHPSDESLFLDLLNRVHIEERGAASSESAAETKTSMEYFAEGSRYFVASDFGKAIGPFENALALEKHQRQMSQNYWRVLVDNLGMAYGITGDLEHAEATLNYGVSQDPGYPMFYYNLACVAAERKDMNKAMDFLGKAFARKANSIPGEGMPDPRQDDSFKRFMSNDQFRKFADSLQPAANQ